MRKKNKQKKEKNSRPKPLSKKQKRIFILITLLIPVIFIILFESVLRLGNYGGDLRLFIPSTTGYENYLRCNPNVAHRYFFMQKTIPSPPKDLFLAEKPKDLVRIFVMGGSTTAGFPYGNNMMFSRILHKQLEMLYPNQKVEVINIAMSAINSYTLLDFIDEVLEQKPDLILIYAGHNEYYGALGVGSVESIGNQRWLVKSYLFLQRFRFFLFLRDMIGNVKVWINGIFSNSSEMDPSATLMARIVAEQTIPFKSDLYKAGKDQFKSNLNDILNKAKQKKVHVIVSELICNIRDQLPFISEDSQNETTANEKFREARLLENAGKYGEAKQAYYQAKNLDALRFRAPEEFNDIINQLATEYKLPVVPMKAYFEKYSPHELIGNNLILEHLHPNSYGYYLMAIAFLNDIIKNKIIKDGRQVTIEPDYQNFMVSWGFTELDKVHADLTIKSLKGSWPFKPKALPNRVLQDFKPKTISEQMALKVLSNPDFGIEMGHLELAEYYEKKKDYIKAYEEYKALIYTIPFETEFYEKAATVLLTIKDYDTAKKILEQSLIYKESFFAIKWLGQISLRNKDYNKAIVYLEKARNMKSNDTQILFNLGRSYYHAGNHTAGDEIFDLLKKIEPNSAYIKNLQSLRLSIN